MLNEIIYNIQGEEMGKINLPVEIFNIEINNNLIYQAVNAQLNNKRNKLAHTKDRSEVRGGGKKPWQQKGTGRARHGSSRSPIWVGGGITFGPRKDKNFDKKINKKAKRKAVLMVLSSKAKDKEIIILDKLELKEGKTKLMAEILKNVLAKRKTNKKKQKSILFATLEKNSKIIKAGRNIPFLKTVKITDLNLLDLLSFKYLLLEKQGIKELEKKYLKSSQTK